ncbi:hypothetical protein E2C01_064968 [Portunus trituberculatus]|uniref:Uncharacterized protein n=1 Tax=Portunus trituberculatus TaxID=210409 RepID=A0A5B7HQG9_PORTR|nr:hypothetical protein [Portunus trituberculatus]
MTAPPDGPMFTTTAPHYRPRRPQFLFYPQVAPPAAAASQQQPSSPHKQHNGLTRASQKF